MVLRASPSSDALRVRAAQQAGRPSVTGTDDPGAYVDLLVVFGPAATDIVE